MPHRWHLFSVRNAHNHLHWAGLWNSDVLQSKYTLTMKRLYLNPSLWQLNTKIHLRCLSDMPQDKYHKMGQQGAPVVSMCYDLRILFKPCQLSKSIHGWNNCHDYSNKIWTRFVAYWKQHVYDLTIRKAIVFSHTKTRRAQQSTLMVFLLYEHDLVRCDRYAIYFPFNQAYTPSKC